MSIGSPVPERDRADSPYVPRSAAHREARLIASRIAGADVVVRRRGAGASRPLSGFRTAWIDPAALLVIAIFVAVAVLVRNVLH